MADWTVSLHEKIIKRFTIHEGQTISIGRGKECSVMIDNTAISRQHVSICQSSGIFFVSDMGSTNGTFVNGKKVEKDEPITENDVISFGKFNLSVCEAEGRSAQESASVSADIMDLDDETIFVGGAQKATPKKQFNRKKAGPKLTILQGGSPDELYLAGKSSVKIGKDQSCDIRIKGFFVAKAQCYIIKRDNKYCIVPQKSWASTFVNDTKSTSETALRPGDIIKISSNIIRFD